MKSVDQDEVRKALDILQTVNELNNVNIISRFIAQTSKDHPIECFNKIEKSPVTRSHYIVLGMTDLRHEKRKMMEDCTIDSVKKRKSRV